MSEHVVNYRDVGPDGQATGPELKVDLTNGYVYDAQGNQVDRWVPKEDNEKTAMLADYAHEYSTLQAAYSMSRVDKNRAAVMLSEAGMSADMLVKMDLGPSDVHLPAAMPNYASGYRNEPPIADLLAPPLLVAKQVDDYFEFDKQDAFQRALPNANLAGEVSEISPRLGNSQYSAREFALGGWVSTQVESNADAPLRILQATTNRVMKALSLERELRVATLLQTTANLDSSVVTTIASGSQWDGGASADPIKDLHATIAASWGNITAIAMALPVYQAFQRNPVVRSYYGMKSSGPAAAAMPTPAEMQAILELPPIIVGKMQYMDSATTKKYVWGNHVSLVRQPEQMPPQSQDDVATAVTFRWANPTVKDGAVTGGWVVRQYYTQNRGSLGGQKVVVVHHDAEKITSKFAAGLLVNAYQ